MSTQNDIPTTAEELKAYKEKHATKQETPSEINIKKNMEANKKAYLANLPTDEEMEEQVIEQLKTIYDPELPVNIYELGLIYNVDCWTDEVSSLKICKITMTLTSATCSMSDIIVQLVESISSRLEYLEEVKVEIVFDPPWGQECMSDEAKLQMGLL
jgi:metal-sulfur cluster biosynthetic enzyme